MRLTAAWDIVVPPHPRMSQRGERLDHGAKPLTHGHVVEHGSRLEEECSRGRIPRRRNTAMLPGQG